MRFILTLMSFCFASRMYSLSALIRGEPKGTIDTILPKFTHSDKLVEKKKMEKRIM